MSDSALRNFTPREIVSELERYIVGQHKAKRAVAVALRNRWRRQQVPGDLRDEIAPKNIIMIGATGVGKTEIARRLAKLAHAPFVKVEASKFTEVGYVGRDVESMIRDLVEGAIQLVQDEEREAVQTRAAEHAEERLIRLLARKQRSQNGNQPTPAAAPQTPTMPQMPSMPNMPQMLGPFVVGAAPQPPPSEPKFDSAELDELRRKLRAGELDDQEVELEVTDTNNPFMTIFGTNGPEEMEVNLKDMLGQLPGFKNRTRRRRLKVPEAKQVLQAQEAHKLIDSDRVQREAVRRTEQAGIVFLDEIDKVAGRQGQHGGPDVSREGVQRDLLPVVEGSTVSTKYGPVKTDHILFIAAGAFHVSKVSDLIPELQGRFPIRVELEPLEKADFVRILREPRNALTKQYQALMGTEGIELVFTDDAVDALADYAARANDHAQNIGARRLHTVLEAVLEELSFDASERGKQKVVVDAAYVHQALEPILSNADLARHIL